MCEWKNAEVLEIGCGEGDLAYKIASLDAKKVMTVDYSNEAIKICKTRFSLENLEFEEAHIKDIEEKFDVIVIQGVLEHLDEPFKDLDNIIKNNLKEKGVVVTNPPSFLNLRGHI